MSRGKKRILSLMTAGVFGLTAAFGLTACDGLPLPVSTEEETAAEETGAAAQGPLGAGVSLAEGETEAPETTTAAEETTTAAETEPPETTAEPQEESTSGIGSAYAGLLSSWQDAYEQLLEGDTSAFDNSELFSFNYVLSNRIGEADRDDRVQGSLVDLNSDGTEELLISTFSADEGTDTLFEVFTYDGEVISLTPMSLALEILGDGTVVARTGKGSSVYDLYRYDGGEEMTCFDGYAYEFAEDSEERSWYHLNLESGVEEPITEEEFDQAIAAHGEAGFIVFPVGEDTLELLRTGQFDELT